MVGAAGLFRIDAVEPEHHRGEQHAAGIVADLEPRPSPGREVAVAGAVDEYLRPHRLPPGLGLDHQRVDAGLVMHHDTGAERMKEDVDLMGGQQIIGRDLVGRGVIGLRQDLAEDQMRRIEPAEPIDPCQEIGGHALHHPMHLAEHIGVQPAKVRHPRRGAHAAKKAVALDQQRAAASARRSHGSSDAGGSATEHDDFVFAVERNLAGGFGDGFGGHGGFPYLG